ncbi:histidinol-phosphate transaminase [Arenimonas sp.]|uniref:histidinol-phosphate transaminase n=1 Tax=Arenimonas sp. TaxID=1872635 RepID=UPI0039E41318
MNSVMELARPDLRDFAGYASARRSSASGRIWLNANESSLASSADEGGRLNRYPDPQPSALRERMATLYGVASAQLMLTRGSDEGIDLLVRGFCRAGVDPVLIAPPCFGMYAVCARLQDAPLVEVPLIDAGDAWRFDIEGIGREAIARRARLVFLCSPGNPTGQALKVREVEALLERLQGRAILVVDEAYVEYSREASAAGLLERYPCLVVLRTLSKAHALAGARVGALLGDPTLVEFLRNLSAPYPIAAPSAECALAALSEECVAESHRRVRIVLRERERLRSALSMAPGVRRIYASEGNYLLVRFADADAALRRWLDAGIVVRDIRAMPGLGDALRVSIGTPSENSAVLAALALEACA